LVLNTHNQTQLHKYWALQHKYQTLLISMNNWLSDVKNQKPTDLIQ
jgi:hypothetical protein